MFQAVVLRVMVASPSDVQSARTVIESALHEWNTVSAGGRGVLLLPWLFETSAVPLAGAHSSTRPSLATVRLMARPRASQ
ncbi:MAG: hypothetical protein LBD77_01740 [Bifidobacteriaceae bacterium]|nr:hypothetical protein [Bifidobacteriaceae bacterium]